MGLVAYLRRRMELADEAFFRKRALYRDRNLEFFNKKAWSGEYFRHDGVLCKILRRGEGDECPEETDTVLCHYECSLIDGTVAASTSRKGTPACLKMDNMIDGFRTAVGRMHVGDTWQVVVPPALGYGSMKVGRVPSFSTLTFTISLIDIIK